MTGRRGNLNIRSPKGNACDNTLLCDNMIDVSKQSKLVYTCVGVEQHLLNNFIMQLPDSYFKCRV